MHIKQKNKQIDPPCQGRSVSLFLILINTLRKYGQAVQHNVGSSWLTERAALVPAYIYGKWFFKMLLCHCIVSLCTIGRKWKLQMISAICQISLQRRLQPIQTKIKHYCVFAATVHTLKRSFKNKIKCESWYIVHNWFVTSASSSANLFHRG